jgi:phospholipid transport system transporter-binding protein
VTDTQNPVARLPERLTLQDAAATLRSLQSAVAAQAGPVVQVDASALRHFDSSAVAVLLELGRDLQRQGRTLQIGGLPPRLRDLVALYGVESLLPA